MIASFDELMNRVAFDRAVLWSVDHLEGAARARDIAAFQEGFDGLDGPERDTVGKLLLRRFERCGDWPGWGWACNRCRWSYLAEAGAGLVASLDQSRRVREAAAKARAPDVRRKMLTRACFAMLGSGTAARSMLARLHAENERYAIPLDPEAVDRLAIWCAERHAENALAG